MFGYLSVRLCKHQVLEALLACDPDVIVSMDKKWGVQLKRLIQWDYPQWSCVIKGQDPIHFPSSRTWSRYDQGVKVSIILPTYNGSRFIAKSIQSCLNQTHTNIELIIVDDGSQDDISGIVSEFGDRRIKLIKHATNKGLPQALNTGFRNSTGEYLTWTSDDNYYAVNAIEELLRFMHTYPHIDLAYAESFIIDEEDSCLSHNILRTHPPEWLKIDDGIGACFLYKRKIYEAVGDYNPAFFKVEDYEYWVRVWKNKFAMQRLFKPLYYYRFHSNTLTAKYRREIEEKLKAVKRLHGIREYELIRT